MAAVTGSLTAAEVERERTDRLTAALEAAMFMLGVIRVVAPEQYQHALDLAVDEGYSIPAVLQRAEAECLACSHHHAGSAMGGICIGCSCTEGAKA